MVRSDVAEADVGAYTKHDCIVIVELAAISSTFRKELGHFDSYGACARCPVYAHLQKNPFPPVNSGAPIPMIMKKLLRSHLPQPHLNA